jgi:hypothetical protein
MANSGGIFGKQSSGNAINCYSTYNINGSGAGGIFGSESFGTAQNCYSEGNINGIGAGGIFGTESSGTAIDSSSSGTIFGYKSGGIFGSCAPSFATSINSIGTGALIGLLTGPIFGYRDCNNSICSTIENVIIELTSQNKNMGFICKKIINILKDSNYSASEAYPIYVYFSKKYKLIQLNGISFNNIY